MVIYRCDSCGREEQVATTVKKPAYPPKKWFSLALYGIEFHACSGKCSQEVEKKFQTSPIGGTTDVLRGNL